MTFVNEPTTVLSKKSNTNHLQIVETVLAEGISVINEMQPEMPAGVM